MFRTVTSLKVRRTDLRRILRNGKVPPRGAKGHKDKGHPQKGGGFMPRPAIEAAADHLSCPDVSSRINWFTEVRLPGGGQPERDRDLRPGRDRFRAVGRRDEAPLLHGLDGRG